MSKSLRPCMGTHIVEVRWISILFNTTLKFCSILLKHMSFFRRTDLFKVAGVRGESCCHAVEVRSSLHISRWPCNLPPRLLVAGASRGSTIKVRGRRSWQSISRGVYSKHKERPPTLSTVHTDVFDVGTISHLSTGAGRPAASYEAYTQRVYHTRLND